MKNVLKFSVEYWGKIEKKEGSFTDEAGYRDK